MRISKKEPKVYKYGDTRYVNRFAWLPIKIKETTIWLEKYQVLEAYIGSTYNVVVDGKNINFVVYSWIVLSKRMMP